MGDLDDSFTRLLGRQATDKERQAIYRARDALNLKATDSVWMLLMALQHYETLYEKIPARIAEAVDAVTKASRLTAEAQAKAAQEETKKALIGAVEQAAVASRKDGARAELVKRAGRMAGGIVVGAVALWILAFKTGQARGEAAGRDGARQQCGYMAAAMSWANSARDRSLIDWRTLAASEIWPAATCPAGNRHGMGCASCARTRARHSVGGSHETRDRKHFDARDR